MPERTIADDALPPCTVRIDVGDSHSGTGFFVAPNVVVTCFHVLKSEEVSSAEARREITILTADGRRLPVLDRRESSPTDADDLAVLRVDADGEHPCVLLDTGLRAGDPLHTYGYPIKHPEGEPTSILSEGWTGGERSLKLAYGQALPGMSGSPVLNLRTGGVCGVLKRSRDPRQALGGYAVPIRLLFELSPALQADNARHHKDAHGAWFDLLPLGQKKLFSRQSGHAAGVPHCVLVISVDQKETIWEVTATVHRNQSDGSWTADPPTPAAEVDLNGVRALVSRLFRDWASRETTVRGRVEPGEQVRLLGEIFSSALLRDEISKEFDRCLTNTPAGQLHVALHFADVDDPDFREFVELPWEHLYLRAKATRPEVYFAREPRLSFLRTLLPEPATEEPTDRKLAVLVVPAKPMPYPNAPPENTDVAAAVESVVSGLDELKTKLAGSIDIEIAEPAGPRRIAELAATGSFDVVHYVGYGRYDLGDVDRIALTTTSGEVFVDGWGFAECLEGEALRLVVLQVSRGAEPVPADLSAFAPPLLMKGTHAVVAQQYPVSRGLARVFNEDLYAQLADGMSVEAAVQSARKQTWMSGTESRAFLSPALFVRSPGGQRLTTGRLTSERVRVGTLSAHA